MQRKKIGLETWEFGWVLTGRSQEGPILPKRWALFSKVFGLFQLFLKKNRIWLSASWPTRGRLHGGKKAIFWVGVGRDWMPSEARPVGHGCGIPGRSRATYASLQYTDQLTSPKPSTTLLYECLYSRQVSTSTTCPQILGSHHHRSSLCPGMKICLNHNHEKKK